MGFLDHHLTDIAERIMEHIDLEEVTRDVLSKLTVTDLELYFVVRPRAFDVGPYEFVGMAYSREAANTLWVENSKAAPCKILQLDLGKAMTLAEQAGIVEEIT